MPTPNFKLLTNALRLGQPPEPTAAIKVLCEVIQHQEGELAELRQRLAILASRVQLAEAKITRFEDLPRSILTSDDARATISEEEESMNQTMTVSRADVEAVVKRVEAEMPYPVAMPGSHRAPHEPTNMPFHLAPLEERTEDTVSSPGSAALGSPDAAVPFTTKPGHVHIEPEVDSFARRIEATTTAS